MKSIYIDGDNNPGICTQGIELLKESDCVKIFYASGNAYYASEKNRTALKNKCKGELNFIKMVSGKNSVDFAVAIEAALDIANNKAGEVFLISGDKHFSSIAIVLNNKIHPRSSVRCVKTISEAIIAGAAQVENLEEAFDIFITAFGDNLGDAFYKRILELHKKESANIQHQKNKWPTPQIRNIYLSLKSRRNNYENHSRKKNRCN